MSSRPKQAIAAFASAAIAFVPLSTADASDSASTGVAPETSDTSVDSQHEASLTAEALEAAMGESYAGAWIDDAGDLNVATTDPADSSVSILTADAEVDVVPVERSLSHLGDITAELADTDAPESVASWGPDAPTNQVVVFTSDTDAASEWVAATDVDPQAVRYEVSHEDPELFQSDIRGGDAYYFGQGRCSIGFAVTGAVDGYVSAGHCGSPGQSVQGHNQQSQGTIVENNFPGDDYNLVQINQNWHVTPLVNTYSGTMEVEGSTAAPVGADLCRSGSTSGFTCQGEILQHDTCVTYQEGTVCGLTRTTVPASPGDSGGSIITPDGQAQGMTSGGGGGVMYYQPVNEALQALGVSLVTEDNGGDPPPDPEPDGCEDYDETYSGSLSQGSAYHPEGGYTAGAGTHEVCLSAPQGFIVFLERQFGNQWFYVNYVTGAGDTDTSFQYNGASGTYRLHVQTWGEGNYTVGLNRP
ncbi:S1 family peptidase [Actinobacteria bacterium YIM 96077]|uniref:S1 family peptidase n=1 Tax=Phytoactinopolyspora halophila TaxID=1981511 RepID=A0A329R2G4_9ACTN|nr:S1 family peptidase [Phytoactinopolyspora halophila]AYY12035.1 S1 family peptidase [Actinobacteria bacterium YIM 96077]RAW18731.1 S1 family peptidase [Phytoactinopolyspora halophila]